MHRHASTGRVWWSTCRIARRICAIAKPGRWLRLPSRLGGSAIPRFWLAPGKRWLPRHLVRAHTSAWRGYAAALTTSHSTEVQHTYDATPPISRSDSARVRTCRLTKKPGRDGVPTWNVFDARRSATRPSPAVRRRIQRGCAGLLLDARGQISRPWQSLPVSNDHIVSARALVTALPWSSYRQ